MGVGSTDSGRKCFKTGLWGSVIAAICCVTPVLVIALGAAGMAAVIPYLDLILFPLLVFSLALTIYGWVRMRKRGGTPTP